MGKLQEFDIAFADGKVVYSPGESLTGTVKIAVSGPLAYKAIKVNCMGSCGVSTKMNDSSWAVEEQYFNSTLSVANKGTLAAGAHSFPFQFPIPGLAPTSFEGPFGKILYRVRAVIDTPRFAKDYKAEKPFYLLNLLNLNEVPDIEKPSLAVATKKFTYLLVKTGTVMLKARSDLRGYAPGQVIKLTAEVHNKSGKDTSCVLASLIQKVTYKTKRTIFDLRTIAEVEGAGVKAGKHAEWKEQIIVPPLPQSAVPGCSLIQIDYFLQVSLKSPDILVTLPIYIGNIAINTSPRSPARPAPPTPAPRVPPTPAPRSAPGATPSAPPAEEVEDLAAGLENEEIPTKSHSQQDPSGGRQPSFSPSAFSYAPGLSFSEDQRRCNASGPSGPLFCVSTGATIPFFAEGGVDPVPTSSQLILPPEYSTWGYPHEPPPSYEESCSGAPTRVDSRR
ncbi:arrestin domain-containing protein 1 [Lepisosteus oculatus]|uniref:arrestin domain-containing protein 1 n=1 Tax=Lepisosteus oculatus TaxID=7918 RepID=UPI003715A388